MLKTIRALQEGAQTFNYACEITVQFRASLNNTGVLHECSMYVVGPVYKGKFAGSPNHDPAGHQNVQRSPSTADGL